MEEKREKGRKKGNRSKKEGHYPYFVSTFCIGPFNRQKKLRKHRDNFKGGKIFPGSHNIYIVYTPAHLIPMSDAVANN